MGNKNDDPASKVVETNDAQKFAEQMGIRLFETSAKENVNVEDVSEPQASDWRSSVCSEHEQKAKLEKHLWRYIHVVIIISSRTELVPEVL